MEFIFSLEDIASVAEIVVAQNPKKVILFHGEMGAGKTTFIKQLCKTLGVTEATSSPTFSLVNEYETTDHQTVYHFDFYRLKNETEALDMGADDYFYSGNWCFIEWAEQIPNLIPDEHSVITIEVLADGNRKLHLN
ncbi:tRNA (adenosine(37)-N6)-threonylcarbamoyltransferase complex ATPase subunit type 1 TsaE [Flavobacterium muglaense]|uniref:tRNA threonylcarbamoyladenosine biosynthesis protein TsaE n=1 Tax=Flavobacterium muglaense TaxID=2764716 RepID=A0A923N5Z1_9FLAO|nr:tRNA (adenosine(37)-N6)-threonylcarbamoyltransferase complex ATPase subunit type 1 TsaE [Flavobacterium muglaense]MBC5839692.1 tRNA (adenosine(37)-N6)-threonylcarbamoyltransferase complex ATPase subunit type 1 TsaE [Flavobacterium muglaense]MBC5846218.1 tRNA (adenosine(37)-N6)-threonylcarbamoyltransferase complex ATPase subunit type 1 TsaE [Flavobacterium muglaense]